MEKRVASRAGLARGLVLAVLVVLANACAVDPSTATPRLANDDAGSTSDASVGDAGGSGSDAGSTRDGSVADAGGSGTDAGAYPWGTPDITPGAPIVAPDATWTKVLFPGGQCRHGGDAYMMVHLNSASKKVAIYQEGGGACFNDSSCTLLNFNLPSYVLGGGIFNFNNAENPIKDWNIFYVPYCTGDVQAGSNPSSYVGPITGTTQFLGYTNNELYLSRILATVPDATDYLLTGSSAGGFGAALNADLFARNAPPTVQRFTMIDDSGMPLGPAQIPSCLQQQWYDVWGFGNSFLPACGAACPTSNGYVTDYTNYLIGKYASDPTSSRFLGGFISSTGDAIMRTFFGYGSNDCGSFALLSAATYSSGVMDLRSRIASQTSQVGTFFYDSDLHTTLIVDKAININGIGIGGLYDTQTASGVRLVDWVRGMLERKGAPNVGP